MKRIDRLVNWLESRNGERFVEGLVIVAIVVLLIGAITHAGGR